MIKNLFLITLLSLSASIAHSELYIGAKGGVMSISNDIPFDDATSIGILLGANIQNSGIAIEGELTTTVSAADHKTNSNTELDIYTLAIYGVYRSSGDFYFKGKGGLVYEYLKISGFVLPLEGEDLGLSLGAGGGFRINDNATLELEYTIIESDIDYISLGINFAF